jgi:hypothetical protein
VELTVRRKSAKWKSVTEYWRLSPKHSHALPICTRNQVQNGAMAAKCFLATASTKTKRDSNMQKLAMALSIYVLLISTGTLAKTRPSIGKRTLPFRSIAPKLGIKAKTRVASYINNGLEETSAPYIPRKGSTELARARTLTSRSWATR